MSTVSKIEWTEQTLKPTTSCKHFPFSPCAGVLSKQFQLLMAQRFSASSEHA